MIRILILTIVLLLSACSESNNNSQTSKLEKQQKTTEVEKKPEPKQKKPEDDPHHGHSHGSEDYINEEYIALVNPYSTNEPNKVVVYDFFGYMCGHCNNFEPIMSEWKRKQADFVKVVHVPVNFQQGWLILQHGYLTAELMGIADENHRKLFDAIHIERKRFQDINQLAEWYSENSNVTKEQFLSTAESFAVDSKLREAAKMTRQMEVRSTPTIVINGKFKPQGKLASREDLLENMDKIISKEAEKMGLLEK